MNDKDGFIYFEISNKGVFVENILEARHFSKNQFGFFQYFQVVDVGWVLHDVDILELALLEVVEELLVWKGNHFQLVRDLDSIEKIPFEFFLSSR